MTFFNTKGLSLKRTCIELRKHKNIVMPKDRMKAHSFLREVNSVIEANPRWEEHIEIDMLKHLMAKAVHSKRVENHLTLAQRIGCFGSLCTRKVHAQHECWLLTEMIHLSAV